MPLKLSFLFGLAGMMMILEGTSLQAEDWTTNDGKVYHEVTVVKVEPDAVTILHHDGGALVSMTNLPPDLQARFHYDAVAAKAAADARAQVQAQLVEAERMADEALASRNATTSDDGTSEDKSDPAAGGTHHSLDELTAAASTLRPDDSDGTHHSIGELTRAASTLRPDNSNGTHHSMDGLVDSMHQL